MTYFFEKTNRQQEDLQTNRLSTKLPTMFFEDFVKHCSAPKDNPKDFRKNMVVLPTQRLCQKWDFEFVQKFGAVLPPQFFTWHQWLDWLISKDFLESPIPEIATPLQTQFLLTKILEADKARKDKQQFDLFRPQLVKEFLGLRRDLLGSNLGTSSLNQLKQNIEELHFAHENAEKLAAQRLESTYALNQLLDNALQINGKICSDSYLRKTQLEILKPETMVRLKEYLLNQNHFMHFYGLSTLNSLGYQILEAAQTLPNIFVHKSSTHASEFTTEFKVTKELTTETNLVLWSCEDAYAEAHKAVQQVSAWLKPTANNKYLPAKTICIAMMDEKLYGDPLAEIFSQEKFNNISRNHAIGSLWRITRLGRLLDLLNNIYFSDNADLFFIEEFCKQNGYGELAFIEPTTLQKASWKRLSEIFPELMWEPFQKEVESLSSSIWEKPYVDSIKTILPLFAESQVHPQGSLLEGVQILRFSELRFQRFEKVFVLGANEGNLPSAAPNLQLISHRMRRRMLLPSPEDKIALEWKHFHHLVEATSELHFSFPRFLAGKKEGVPARFLNRLEGIELKQAQPTHNLELVKTPPERLDNPHFDLKVETLSPSAVDDLLRCPLRLMMRRTGVDTFIPANTKMDPRKEGELLHKLLETALSGRWGAKVLVPGAPKALAQETTKELLQKRLLENLQTSLNYCQSKPATHLDPWTVWQLQQHSFRAWAEFVSDLWEASASENFWRNLCTEKEWNAYILPNEKSATNQNLNKTLHFSGRLDLCHPSSELSVLIDYKRSVRQTRKDLSLGKYSQLAIYALALQQNISKSEKLDSVDFDQKPTLVGYWDILKGTWHPMNTPQGKQQDLETYSKLIGNKKQIAGGSLTEILATIKSRLKTRLDTYEQSGYRVQIDPSDCGYCEYSGVCRRNEPKFVEHKENQI